MPEERVGGGSRYLRKVVGDRFKAEAAAFFYWASQVGLKLGLRFRI